MCIRDRPRRERDCRAIQRRQADHPDHRLPGRQPRRRAVERGARREACLLYTSDAADERSSVDLGGRRIIKKKKTYEHDVEEMYAE